tara:strand:- start:1084 stop:1593 length:510 start_codon:yes stop_codon:yes gene_type:complete
MIKVIVPVFFVICASVAVAMKASDRWSEPEPVVAENTEKDFRPEAPGPRATALRMENDGHYWADAQLEGKRVKLMVDTGASMIALSRRDAERMGHKIEDLDFKYEVRTAGGMTQGAYILIDEVVIGNVKVKDVDALVIATGLETSLLGMSFLKKLSSFEFRKNSLIIRQ